ncbi:helix-turn-helix transcriptional regulator [Georgenia halophila]|uniref:Helix-turn-helix transcriptional regulator n=1 Tax=Georgenia halophila TaxID=620889 RepID=A0ABP8LJ08_9MICO
MSLADHLRALRGRTGPERVGLPLGGPRRVTGLRREEVAVLAGVSVDYYTRLEQGREDHPSAQVVDSLGRAFDLHGDERDHLFLLAGLVPPPTRTVHHVAPHLTGLLDRWSDQPAFVLSPLLDVLARNELGAALFAPLRHADNLARAVFLDPDAPAFYDDWHRAAESTVAHLRHTTATLPEEQVRDLVDELSAASRVFGRLWGQSRVQGKTEDSKRFHHPEVGVLDLRYHTFTVNGSRGQQLLVYEAGPGSDTERSLALLGSLAATDRPVG